MFLLDTNIISYLMREGNEKDAIIKNLKKYPDSQLFVSAITYFEIKFGISKAQLKYGDSYKNKQFIEIQAMLDSDTLLKIDFNSVIASQAAQIKSVFLHEGVSISDFDIFIATTAIVHGLTLITRNTKDFEKMCTIGSLKIEDWTQ